MHNHFIIYFSDNTKFEGDQFKEEWENIPEGKIIKKIHYFIGNQQYILQGYEEYNHKFENINIMQKGNIKSAIILLAREKNRCIHIRFDFRKNKILKTFTKLGQEYVQPIWEGDKFIGWEEGMMVSGWLKGLSGHPQIYCVTPNAK